MPEKGKDVPGHHNNNNYVLSPGNSRQLLLISEQKSNKTANKETTYVRENVSKNIGHIHQNKLLIENQTPNDESSNFNLDWVHNTTNTKISLKCQNLSIVEINRDKTKSKMEQSQDIDLYSYPNNPNYDVASSRSQLPTNNDTVNLDLGDVFTKSGDFFDGHGLDGQLSSGSVEAKRRMSEDYNHLDEPILDTLLRDLFGIYNKMKIIALPLSSYDIYKVVLRGWDLWGPLLLCTFLAFNLHHSENKDKHVGPHFADVFVLVWFGSCVVSLNYRLLSVSSLKNQTVSSQLSTGQTLRQQQNTPSNSLDDNLRQDLDSSKNIIENLPSTNIMMAMQENPYQTLLSPPSLFQLMCVFGYCLIAPCFGLILLKIFSLSSLYFERIIIGLIFGFAWPTFCSMKILIRYQHPNKRALAIYPIGLFFFVLSCMIILNH